MHPSSIGTSGRARRLVAGTVAALVALTTTALSAGVTAGSADAAPNSRAYNAARWLDDQLTDGLVHNDQYDVDDYGLSLDVFLAFRALGTRPRAAGEILAALEADPMAYVGSGGEKYAGAYAKLAAAVQLAGEDATSFGGLDLVAGLEDLVDDSGTAQDGRASDVSEFGNYSNTIGQSWAVRVLATVGSPRAADALGFLVKQQCAAGFFRVDQWAGATASYTCDGGTPDESAPSVDATVYGIQALRAAKAAGLTLPQGRLAAAVHWLVAQQRTNGSYVGNGVANSNTTGLAAALLRDLGRSGRAGNAAAWLLRLQVTDALAEGTALATELGAIAYDAAALRTGLTDGIPVDMADQWRRATAQAAVGIDALLPAKRLSVRVPHRFVHARSTTRVRFSGLEPGERYVVRRGLKVVATGFAGRAGGGRPQVWLPRGTGQRTISVTGSRASRHGAVTVQVLAAARLPLTLRANAVDPGATQRVVVRGLAPAERVRLFYRGARIASGAASPAGVFRHEFGVGGRSGAKQLRAVGAFPDRRGTVSFRVR